MGFFSGEVGAVIIIFNVPILYRFSNFCTVKASPVKR